MPSILSQRLTKLLSLLSGHHAILLSLSNDAEAKRLASYLRDARKASLTILALQFTYHFSVQQSGFASWVLVFILYNLITSAFYDGLDIESFRARITSVGPIGFTIIHIIPNLAVAALLVCEIVTFPKSLIIILIQALVIAIVSLLPVLCALWSLNVEAGQATVNFGLDDAGRVPV